MQFVYIACSLISLSSIQSLIHVVHSSKISNPKELCKRAILKIPGVAEQLPKPVQQRSGFLKKPPENDNPRKVIDLNSPPEEDALDGQAMRPQSLARTDATPSHQAQNAANNQGQPQFAPPLPRFEEYSVQPSPWLGVYDNHGGTPMLYHPGYNILSFVPLPIKEDGSMNPRGWLDEKSEAHRQTSRMSSAISQQPQLAATPPQGHAVWPSSMGLGYDRWITPAGPSAPAFEPGKNHLQPPPETFPTRPSAATSKLVDLGPAGPSYGPMRPFTTAPRHPRPKELKLLGGIRRHDSNKLKAITYLSQAHKRKNKNNVPLLAVDAQRPQKTGQLPIPESHSNHQETKAQTVGPEEVGDNFNMLQEMLSQQSRGPKFTSNY